MTQKYDMASKPPPPPFDKSFLFSETLNFWRGPLFIWITNSFIQQFTSNTRYKEPHKVGNQVF